MDLKEDASKNDPKENTPDYSLFIKIFLGLLGVVAILMYFASGMDKKTTYQEPVATSQAKSTTSQQSTIKDAPSKTELPVKKAEAPPKLGSLNEPVGIGKFEYVARDPKITSNLKTKYNKLDTENQFVVVQIQMKNNDDRARDFSTNLFKIKDSKGKLYNHLDQNSSVTGDEILFYETINPGLSRTKTLVFETPKDLTGFTLECDSGVMLSGGEKVLIDLGI